jgi:hypothetical protein
VKIRNQKIKWIDLVKEFLSRTAIVVLIALVASLILGFFAWNGGAPLDDVEPINPADIDTIKVSVLNEDKVEVVAQSSSGSQLKAASFVRGKHFQLRNGQLEILSRSQVAGFQAGEPMVGVASEKIVVGLDSQGNGKVRQNMSATGMAFLIIPMHVSEETNLRFVKIP